jgi:hypothetical protein
MTDAHPTPDYRPPKDDPNPYLAGLARGSKLTAGFVVGNIAAVVLGFLGAMVAEDRTEFQYHSPLIATLFFALTLGGIAATVWGLARPPRRWFLAGLTLGAALASIMEGSCFISG